eukprot:TRINITY_DN5926_c0_g1_i1.p1 TRINITY_DN5926_c0_g1~~TRINITY_DN5926_c0_g1_i1.p1  ORF type:complete len:463 (+),score=101.52 TRINITY_DN5926_c0_g1_i1:215-1603(+)
MKMLCRAGLEGTAAQAGAGTGTCRGATGPAGSATFCGTRSASPLGEGAAERSGHYARTPAAAALQPVEAHVVADAALWHYNALWHALEPRGPLPERWWEEVSAAVPAGSFLVVLTSAYRYVQQDVGHAVGALSVAAAAHGMTATLLSAATDDALAAMVKPARPERVECAVCVHPGADAGFAAAVTLLPPMPDRRWRERVGPAFARMRTSRAVRAAAEAGVKRAAGGPPEEGPPKPACGWFSSAEARRLIRARRSAQGWTVRGHPVAGGALGRVLDRVLAAPLAVRITSVAALVFVSRSADLAAGVYLFDPAGVAKAASGWGGRDRLGGRLVCLSEDAAAGRLGFEASMEQGRNADVIVAFLGRADRVAAGCQWRYRELFWQAGAASQAMYLAVEQEGLRGSALGAYHADFTVAIAQHLGLGAGWIDLLHWAFGRPTVHRGRTMPAYSHLDELAGVDRDTYTA